MVTRSAVAPRVIIYIYRDIVPSSSMIVTVAKSGSTVTRSPSLARSAGASVKLAVNVSVPSGIVSFTIDTLKESWRTLLLNGPRRKSVRAP